MTIALETKNCTMVRHLLLFAFITLAFSWPAPGNYPQFIIFERRRADPCNKFLLRLDSSSTLPTHCETLPDAAVTVLVPSVSSTYTVPADRTVTMNGKNFLTTIPAATNIGLTAPGVRQCSTANVVLPVAATVTDSTVVFTFPDTWRADALELESVPRSLCIQTSLNTNPYVYTGFKIGVVYHCNPANNLACPPPLPVTNPAFSPVVTDFAMMSLQAGLQRLARTTCCVSNLGVKWTNVGQCILSRTNPIGPQQCCGGSAIAVATDKCCDATTENVRFHYQPCPCSISLSCPTGQSCCMQTKYTELIQATDFGECYVPITERCCNTGKRYDPGRDQCCSINGIQSLNIPCPCSTDTDCLGGQPEQRTSLRCCIKVNTSLPYETNQCSAYANFPIGTAPYQTQRCPGTCFDTSYQICCNGVQCIKSYEKCCNSTCCNRFTGTCDRALREGSQGSPSNWVDFMVYYEVCTEVEQMSPHRALWLFVYPCLWLLTTLLSTGLVLVFAYKAASRSFAAIEHAMMVFAVSIILLSIIFFFCPAYKYAFVIIFVQLFTILTAAARIKELNILCVFLQVVLIIYLFDPFHGNQYFTLASSRLNNGQPDRETAGIIHIIGKMWRSNALVASEHFCPEYYLGHGLHDEILRDTDRFDNPNIKHFAYCSRAYIALLLYFGSMVMMCVIVEAILTLIALMVRFTMPDVKLIMREVDPTEEEEFFPAMPVY